MSTIAASPLGGQWALFAHQVLASAGIEPERHEGFRLAFYAGAAAALNLVSLVHECELDGEVAVSYLRRLNAEVERYIDEVSA